MNLVDAFKTFRNPSDNSESWRIFCHVFPVKVDNDPSLRALIAENAQLMYLHTEHNATKSIFATTATFTKGAKELAEKRHRWTLELKDMEGVLAWIDKVIAIKKRRG